METIEIKDLPVGNISEGGHVLQITSADEAKKMPIGLLAFVESGTWTPVVSEPTNSKSGNWVRIGPLVYIRANIVLQSTVTIPPDKAWEISGLPFDAINNTNVLSAYTQAFNTPTKYETLYAYASLNHISVITSVVQGLQGLRGIFISGVYIMAD